jgi:phenylalanyl-tRNA synthetase alpha chain
VVAVFRQLGFAVFDGPEIEHEANNFTLLGFPPDHPATDMQDSFWTESGHLLRTHTSNIQIRAVDPALFAPPPGAAITYSNEPDGIIRMPPAEVQQI